MPTRDKELKLQLEELVEQHFASGSDPARNQSQELKTIIETGNIHLKKYDDYLVNHFYRAPVNILKAQISMAMLVVVIILALAAVRLGTDFAGVLFFSIIGMLLALPYVFIFFVLKAVKEEQLFLIVTTVSFVYSFFLSVTFALVSSAIGLLGVILIPMLILIFYALEIKKLIQLFNKNTK